MLQTSSQRIDRENITQKSLVNTNLAAFETISGSFSMLMRKPQSQKKRPAKNPIEIPFFVSSFEYINAIKDQYTFQSVNLSSEAATVDEEAAKTFLNIRF